jgi:hypothetical protein
MCRLLGDCRYGAPIDLEVGDARGETIVAEPLMSYVRYDADLTRPALDRAGAPPAARWPPATRGP